MIAGNVEQRELLKQDLMELAIRIGLIAFILVMCVRVFAPFAGLMAWALILAVALYPLHLRFVGWLAGRGGLAATALVLTGLVLIGLPTAMLGASFANHIHDLYAAFESNSVTVPQPNPSVAAWPLIGEKVHAAWSAAATDLPGFLHQMQPQLGNFARQALSVAASTAGAVMAFLGSLIIAGIMMAYGESGSAAMQRIIDRASGPARGPKVMKLVVATVRSVATGVIGVAFIQALLLGIGFLIAGIPAAGILAIIVLLIGILQLPALIITIPAIAYLWMGMDGSTTGNVIFTVYLLVAGAADGFLKPMLLGRGVDAPMPVVLLGALGGMVSAGIIGLFIGAVLLTVGYQVFMDWVNNEAVDSAEGATESMPEPLGGND